MKCEDPSDGTFTAECGPMTGADSWVTKCLAKDEFGVSNDCCQCACGLDLNMFKVCKLDCSAGPIPVCRAHTSAWLYIIILAVTVGRVNNASVLCTGPHRNRIFVPS